MLVTFLLSLILLNSCGIYSILFKRLMIMHKNKIQHSFDRAANSYDKHCHAQKSAGLKLTHLLKSHHSQAEHLLDLGCGTGTTTQFLADQYQYLDFHAIDISQGLLNKAHERLDKSGIQFHNMDFDHLTAFNTNFDIIYSNMALQWSTNLFFFNKYYLLLHENGTLAFSIPYWNIYRITSALCHESFQRY